MDVAIARFNEFQSMRRELEKAENQLSECKDIERAKHILMKHRGWPEDEAYQGMRRMAMDKSEKLVEVARQLIAVADLLG